MSDPEFAPKESAGPAPVRTLNSVRRTSTIDTSWPEGRDGPMLMRGDSRDLATGAELSELRVLATASFEIVATSGREIRSIDTTPTLPNAEELIGVRAGGQSRKAIGAQLQAIDAMNSPLHLLLDDFAGASLVAGWAWSRWTDWAVTSGAGSERVLPKMEGICAGFRPGASSLDAEGRPAQNLQSSAPVGLIVNSADLNGFHNISDQEGVGMRRVRWMDVHREGDSLNIAAGFQDSATDPSGGREAVHEYRLTALVDQATGALLEVEADPRVLPYRECPAAVGNIERLLGVSVGDFRQEVLSRLPGTLGCTHLNDVLRSLADVSQLEVML